MLCRKRTLSDSLTFKRMINIHTSLLIEETHVAKGLQRAAHFPTSTARTSLSLEFSVGVEYEMAIPHRQNK